MKRSKIRGGVSGIRVELDNPLARVAELKAALE
jgi:hypothetical protein